MTISRGLWNYYRDKIDNVDDNASDSKSFKYKTKIMEKSEARPDRPAQGSQKPIPPLNTEFVVPIKYLSNFWRPLDLPLINC